VNTSTIHPPRRLAGDFLRSSRQTSISEPVQIVQTREALELIAKRAVDGRETIRQAFLRSTIRDAAINSDGTPKPLEGTINTGEVDRYQSIIVPAGMDFTAFRANPVMLWMHGLDAAGSWPVGRVLEINRTAELIGVKWEFDLDGELAAELDRLYRQKWLRGLSVGVIPIAYDFIMVDGRSVIRYTASELAELSWRRRARQFELPQPDNGRRQTAAFGRPVHARRCHVQQGKPRGDPSSCIRSRRPQR